MSPVTAVQPVLDERGNRVGQVVGKRTGMWAAFARSWRGLLSIGEFRTRGEAEEMVRKVAALPGPAEPIVGMEILP